MDHILIVSAGYLNIDFARDYIRTLSFDKVFAVDGGLKYTDELLLSPDLIIGDFDTVDEKLLERYEKSADSESDKCNIIRYPSKKAQSDTELAVSYAVKEGAGKITLLGATGSRLDHTLANIGLFSYAADKGVELDIVDSNNRVRFLSSEYGVTEFSISKDAQFGRYVSLIPLSELVEGVTLSGMLYPLTNAVLYYGKSLSVSNEIEKNTAHIHIEKGAVLVIESRD